VKILELVKSLSGPVLVHVTTEKGKGYKPAEEDDLRLHASTPFDKITGKALKPSSGVPSYTKILGDALIEIVGEHKEVVGITAAMGDGTGLDHLQEKFPSNLYDVGIAEEHAVTFAAGMATQGITPVVAVYSTFLQRAFDQIIHDVSLQDLHVVFILDRAGLVGADGPTHHGSFDLSYLRLIPNMVIMAPKDEAELRDMAYTAIIEYKDGPVALRYPRGSALGVELKPGFRPLPIGKGEIVRQGSSIALLAVGSMVSYALTAASILEPEGIDCHVINMRFIKPLDTELLDETAAKFPKMVTLEENALPGGFGSAVSEYLADTNKKNDLLRIGLPDRFIEHGTQQQLHAMLGIDPAGIAEKIKQMLGK
jgi:1-deoxy-D-xylulose-5-phosphate synthase